MLGKMSPTQVVVSSFQFGIFIKVITTSLTQAQRDAWL